MQKPLITLAKDRDFAAGFHFKLVHTINLLSLIGQNWWTKGWGHTYGTKTLNHTNVANKWGWKLRINPPKTGRFSKISGGIYKQPASLNFPTFAFGGACNFSFWAWIVVGLMVLIGDGILLSLTFNFKKTASKKIISKNFKIAIRRVGFKGWTSQWKWQFWSCKWHVADTSLGKTAASKFPFSIRQESQ